MAASVISAELVTWSGDADPAGQTVTVPSDCTAAYLVHQSYNGAGTSYITTATLGAASADAIYHTAGANQYYQSSVAVWYNPLTGSRTVDIVLNAAPSEGPVSHLIYVKGGDLTAWRDVEAVQGGTPSVTLTTETGDLVIKYDGRYSGAVPPDLTSGWTNIATGDNNQRSVRASYISASGTTQVCASENVSSSSILGFSIPTGAEPPISITAGAGALTATGTTPVLDIGIIPGAGSITVTGAAPTDIERGLRYAYPTADTTAGPWAASSGSDLFAMIDEETASDTDYIYANATGTGKFKILPVTDPGASTGHVVNYRIWSPVAGNAKVRLVQGSTTVAEWTHTGLPTTATLYSQSLTGEQADAITDYDDLYLEFEAT